MTNTYQTDLDDDDALGLAMRAFVDEFLAKGADTETIIYLLACDMFRTAVSVLPDRARAFSIVAKAASDLRGPLAARARVMVEE